MNTLSKIAMVSMLAPILGMTPAMAVAQQIYAYPAKHQSEAQQSKDHQACHGWAVKQSGFDPGYSAPPPQQRGGMVRGAAGGAAIGAVGGAIGGNAGRGAAIGAGTGALIGGIRQHRQNEAAAEQQQARLTAYNSALATCFRGRGYTVN